MTMRGRPGILLIGVLGGVLLCQSAAQAQWKKYSPGERYEALQNYRRHRELPKQRQKEIERQYQRYQKMPEGERERIRKNYQRFQQMPPRQRSELEHRSRSSKGKGKGSRD
jgi:hypothetical protein